MNMVVAENFVLDTRAVVIGCLTIVASISFLFYMLYKCRGLSDREKTIFVRDFLSEDERHYFKNEFLNWLFGGLGGFPPRAAAFFLGFVGIIILLIFLLGLLLS